MKLGNLIIGHDFREIYRHNPILDSNLVFATFAENLKRLLENPETQRVEALSIELESATEDSYDALNRELDSIEEMLEAEDVELKEEEVKLKEEENPKKRKEIKEDMERIGQVINRLRNKSREFEDQMDRLAHVSATSNFTAMDGLMNNVRELDKLIADEEDKKKKERLEIKKVNCLDALAIRQAPIVNITELTDAVDQIESDQHLIDRRLDGKLDQVDIELLLNSDMLPFIDNSLKEALDVARAQMFESDSIQRVFSRTHPTELREDADLIWEVKEEESTADIAKLEEEEDGLEKRLYQLQDKKGSEADDRREIEGIERRLQEIESEIEYTKDQISDNKQEWISKTITNLEINHSNYSVLGSVNLGTLEKLKHLLRQAQAIRMERVQDFLAKELEELDYQLAAAEKGNIFTEKTLKSIKEELAEARSIIVDQKQNDPEKIRRLANNFQSAKIHFSISRAEVQEGKNNRPQIEAQIASDYERFQTALGKLTPEVIHEITKRYKEQMAKEGISEDSAISNKAMTALRQISDPNSDVHDKMKELTRRLQNISEIDVEELLAISQDLKTIRPTMDFLENLDANLSEALSPENQDAQLAHQTIQALEQATTHEKIKSILESKEIAEHIEFVSPAEFKKLSKGITTEGDMLIEEEGNKWKIIINEKIFSKTVAEVKNQIIHELLHVEFERSKSTKDSLRKSLKSNLNHWKKIREAFIKKENYQKKKAPDGENWKDDGSHDDDILSEIFAMQNELSQNLVKADKSKGELGKLKANLNNLLIGAGISDAIEVAKKAREYEEENKKTKKKRRGYAAGVEAGEDNRDPSQSVTNVATVSKEHAIYDDNKTKIDELTKRMKELGKSEYLSMVPGANELVNAMDGYNDGTADLNEDLRKEPDSEVFAAAISGRIDQVTDDLNDLEEQIGKAARNAPNTEIGLVRKLWINTTFLSMKDFVQLGINTYEFIQRTHKRNVEDHAAKLGMALFSGTDLGRESRARHEKAEAEEVNEWKSRYETLDAWELMAELKGIANSHLPNQDQVKAILRILASKGRLDWRGEDLWTVLNKLQSSVVLKPGDKLLLHNPILLRQRLHAALGKIYDYDEFTTLERDNEGAYQSGKGKYDTVHSRMQDQLNGRLDELLAQHRAGEQVEPMLYESIIEYAIKNGKCFAENVMFHLIAGMAEGLLPPDRGMALGEHLNAWPAVDWFTTHRPPMSTADWKRFALQNFKKSFMKGSITANGFGDDFQNWYWTEVQNCPKVIERVKKSVGERSWDHDWGRSIACLGDSRTAKQFLSGRSGQQETKITGVGNAYTGAVQWLEENSKNPKFASREEFARMAGWIAMTEGILDGTAYKEASNDNNTRADASMDNSIPREAGIGRHGGKSVRAHRDIVSAFVMRLDPEFFSMIKGREAKTEDVKKELGTNARDYLMNKYPAIAADLEDVEDIDSIYSRIDLIIGAIFDQISEEEFQKILLETAP